MHIKYYFWLCLHSLIITGCDPDPKSILKQSYHKCQSIVNGTYHMSRYYTDSKDIETDHYKCYFKKNPEDSLISSKFLSLHYFKGRYQGEIQYTGNELITLKQQDSTVTILQKKTQAKEIRNNQSTRLLYSPFTHHSGWPFPNEAEYDSNKYQFRYLGIEIIEGHRCHHIQMNDLPIDPPDSPVKTIKLEYHFWISKVDSIPIQYSFLAEGIMTSGMIGDTVQQYFKDLLHSFELNSLDEKINLNSFSIPNGFKIKPIAPCNKMENKSITGNLSELELYDLNGEIFSFSSTKGKYVLLDFFYPSCKPCIKQLPILQKIHQKYKNSEFLVVGINVDDSSAGALIAFIQQHSIKYKILPNGAEIAKFYNVHGYPTMFLIDKNGQIIYSHMGLQIDLEKHVEKALLTYQ